MDTQCKVGAKASAEVVDNATIPVNSNDGGKTSERFPELHGTDSSSNTSTEKILGRDPKSDEESSMESKLAALSLSLSETSEDSGSQSSSSSSGTASQGRTSPQPTSSNRSPSTSAAVEPAIDPFRGPVTANGQKPIFRTRAILDGLQQIADEIGIHEYISYEFDEAQAKVSREILTIVNLTPFLSFIFRRCCAARTSELDDTVCLKSCLSRLHTVFWEQVDCQAPKEHGYSVLSAEIKSMIRQLETSRNNRADLCNVAWTFKTAIDLLLGEDESSCESE